VDVQFAHHIKVAIDRKEEKLSVHGKYLERINGNKSGLVVELVDTTDLKSVANA
jgi:hypothetical protein